MCTCVFVCVCVYAWELVCECVPVEGKARSTIPYNPQSMHSSQGGPVGIPVRS